MTEQMKQLINRFPCEYSIYKKGTDPETLEDDYLKALREWPGEGYYPAILVADEYVEDWLGFVFEEGYDREAILKISKDQGKELLQERFREYIEDYEMEMGIESSEESEAEMREFIGEETYGEVLMHFSAFVSYDGPVLIEDILLLKIPVQNPWEIIAWIPMGGWNECPPPEHMISICKYWYESYGAIPAVFSHDELEFYTPKHLNGMDSLEAAKEHYAFCPDRIDQATRTGTLSELAAGLAESERWYFWWD